jgi:superfamily I DNA and/or RNA helicase
MHPDISAFVSRRFYDGELHDFPHTADRETAVPPFLPASPALLVLDTRRLPDRWESERARGRYANLTECALATHVVRSFAEHPRWRELGLALIAPYGEQVELLRRRARRDPVLGPLLREGRLQVGTVDSFQGQERDLVVFSCTRSNRGRGVGFVDKRQRLNVALSRARAKLVVLADGGTIEQAARRLDADGDGETRMHLAALLEHARANGGLLEVPPDWRTRSSPWHEEAR